MVSYWGGLFGLSILIIVIPTLFYLFFIFKVSFIAHVGLPSEDLRLKIYYLFSFLDILFSFVLFIDLFLSNQTENCTCLGIKILVVKSFHFCK
jgi:hypothetical protein